MLELMLLRHAKSSWEDPAQQDQDRPLLPKGEDAARRMATHILEEDILPDRILCSTSVRTRQTLKILSESFGREIPTELMPELYADSKADYLADIRSHGQEASRLLVIGHNPALESTAKSLVTMGPDKAMQALREKYPTAALAYIGSPAQVWSGLMPRDCFLKRFIRPKDLI